MKKLLLAALTFLFASGTAMAGPWCDSFEQDWNITTSTGPGGMIVISGCRDCDNSLGCAGPLSLDGAFALDLISGGLTMSTTAYDSANDSCASTHWNAVFVDGQFAGNVSNESGPFGSFTLSPGSCRVRASADGDPAK